MTRLKGVWLESVIKAFREVRGYEVYTALLTQSPPAKQKETATVVGTIGAAGAGDAEVVVRAADLVGSPLTVPVAVANNDTASDVAGKIRTALGAVSAITDIFTVGGSGADVTLEAIVEADDDGTLNISIDNDTCTGLTAAPTSTNTTVGNSGVPVAIELDNSIGEIVAEYVSEGVYDFVLADAFPEGRTVLPAPSIDAQAQVDDETLAYLSRVDDDTVRLAVLDSSFAPIDGFANMSVEFRVYAA
jgi:hypothetical protein